MNWTSRGEWVGCSLEGALLLAHAKKGDELFGEEKVHAAK
jgi:hypothetical protein